MGSVIGNLLEIIMLVVSNTMQTLSALISLLKKLTASFIMVSSTGWIGFFVSVAVLVVVLFFLTKFFFKSIKTVIILFVAAVILLLVIFMG